MAERNMLRAWQKEAGVWRPLRKSNRVTEDTSCKRKKEQVHSGHHCKKKKQTPEAHIHIWVAVCQQKTKTKAALPKGIKEEWQLNTMVHQEKGEGTKVRTVTEISLWNKHQCTECVSVCSAAKCLQITWDYRCHWPLSVGLCPLPGTIATRMCI